MNILITAETYKVLNFLKHKENNKQPKLHTKQAYFKYRENEDNFYCLYDHSVIKLPCTPEIHTYLMLNQVPFIQLESMHLSTYINKYLATNRKSDINIVNSGISSFTTAKIKILTTLLNMKYN